MVGCSTRTIKVDPTTNYYEMCAECLEACEKWVEAGMDPATRPEQCVGCPFGEEDA